MSKSNVARHNASEMTVFLNAHPLIVSVHGIILCCFMLYSYFQVYFALCNMYQNMQCSILLTCTPKFHQNVNPDRIWHFIYISLVQVIQGKLLRTGSYLLYLQELLLSRTIKIATCDKVLQLLDTLVVYIYLL